MDYVRQVQCEMMDDMIEKGDPSGSYKREPFVGEDGEYSPDQPPLDEEQQARKHVRTLPLLFVLYFDSSFLSTCQPEVQDRVFGIALVSWTQKRL